MEKALSQRNLKLEIESDSQGEQSENYQANTHLGSGYKEFSNRPFQESTTRSVATQDQQCDHKPTAKKAANASDLRKQFERQNYKCAACGLDLDPRTVQLDHVRPRSDGGGDEASNLQWLCVGCNKAKGTMSMGAFIAMCERIAQNATMRAEELDAHR